MGKRVDVMGLRGMTGGIKKGKNEDGRQFEHGGKGASRGREALCSAGGRIARGGALVVTVSQ